MTPREKLHKGILELGLAVNEQQEGALFQYLQLLEKWNQKFNLTAVRDINEMVSLHLLDSLSIAPFINTRTLLDVGSGAGLPGIPLAICFPDIQVTLLDSNGKKVRFCRQAIMELDLKNAQAVQARIESLEADNSFGQITSRAFTGLDNMVKLLEKQLSDKTQLLAMKGALPGDEIEFLQKSGYQVDTQTLNVPFVHAERHLLKICR
ncbi:MAG: 16S rRNA (guanine(527)-N(7))-methyltransferase RsmG [Gammaproteobacteria bacterium]|nr:16S rRNA (guanine(527)-N(7))-methyltransferase RsmG [Gammaproteobacteria bacterium]